MLKARGVSRDILIREICLHGNRRAVLPLVCVTGIVARVVTIVGVSVQCARDLTLAAKLLRVEVCDRLSLRTYSDKNSLVAHLLYS